MKTSVVFGALLFAGAALNAQVEGTSPARTAAGSAQGRAAHSMAPLNPRFLEYLDAVKRGAAEGRLTGAAHGLGLLPEPLDLSHLKSQPAAVSVLGLPASYDLRASGRVTPVRDQEQCGSCWSFATYGAMESVLQPAETTDLSENHLKNLHGFDYSPCYGGTYAMATAYLTRWAGPVYESDDPYQPTDRNNSPSSRPPRMHVQDVITIAGRRSSLDNDALKSAVMKYGGVGTVMWMSFDSGHYNRSTAAYYNPKATTINHAVTLVGWDDNYSRSNFSSAPPGDGAFLIKNSYGTSWGKSGYFWISYYDTAFAKDASYVFVGSEAVTNYTRQYSYDPLGRVGGYGYRSETAWFANVFTSQGQEQLQAVSFYAASNNSPYLIRIYTGVAGGAVGGTLAVTTTGTASTAGYHTFSLPSPVPLASGTRFAVVVRLTTPGYKYPIPVQYAVPGYSSAAIASPGRGYISRDGTSWTDATNGERTMSICLKAFTSTADAKAPSVVTSAAASITGSGARLGADINPNGSATRVWFLYGTDSSMKGAASTPAQDVGSGTAAIPVSVNISGLTAGTRYYFQAMAQNGVGNTPGSILNFTTTTGAQPPAVSTLAATSVTVASAALAGSVNPNGSPTYAWFLYSTSSVMDGASATPRQDLGSGTAALPVSVNIGGLAVNTRYYFQVVAQNSAGTTPGAILNFMTPGSPQLPSVTTAAAGSITNSGAILGGNVNPNGSATRGWFAYSTNSSLSGAVYTAEQEAWSGTVPVPLSANLTGLAADTTYYFQAMARNGAGAGVGSIQSFRTNSGQSVFVQQGGKLAGLGGVLALSADGNTAIVGDSFDTHLAGAARVITRSGDTWTQQAKLVGTGAVGGAGQGQAVAMSADGNTAIIGGPTDAHAGAPGENRHAGAAWVFTRSGGVWRQQGGKLVGRGAVGDARQGHAVALSADGNTAIVGGPDDDKYAGAAWVFTRSGDVWTQQAKLAGGGAERWYPWSGAEQGWSVALSADGNTALVGGLQDNGGTGAAWVFTRSGGVWTQQGDKLVPGGAVGPAWFGAAVSLSADGNTALIGGDLDYDKAGAAWVFTRSDGTWTQQAKLVGAGAMGKSHQGQAVALSADGDTAIVGGPIDNSYAGAAWIFTRVAGVWTQKGSKLVGSGGVGYPKQGRSVALSGDGKLALVGGDTDAEGGGVWSFGPSVPLSLLNGFSFQPGYAPGMILSVSGANLASSTQTADATPLPLTLAGVSVEINGVTAPLYSVSPTQIYLQIPYETQVGPAQLTLNNNGQMTTTAFTVFPSAPGIATNSAGMLSTRSSATGGQNLFMFITGEGAVTPAVKSGWTPAGTTTPEPKLPVSVTVGGISAPLLYVGIPSWSVGVTLIAFTLPQSVPSGTQNVVVTVGGVESPPAKIVVQ